MRQNEGFLTVADGVRLFYQTLGEGPSLVFPNGIYLFDDFRRLAEKRTLIFYDVRNRGRSDTVTEAIKLQRGIHNDVDDLEAIRHHFGIAKMDLVAHSYIGLMVMLYAMKYREHAGRIVQIGPTGPYPAKEYPPHLCNADAALREAFAKIGEIQKERAALSPEEFCKKFWSILRVIYVANPAHADKINWGRCHLPNERNLMKYMNEHISPSMQSLRLAPNELAQVQAAVLTIHGRKDRSAPYGGGREWALLLPNARLVTIEDAAHAPWIEKPEQVFSAIYTFLGGAWPDGAEKVTALDPA